MDTDSSADETPILTLIGRAVLHGGPFDLVLTDLMMPRMDGLELFKAARALPVPRPPFLFLTAKADEATKLAALDEGAIDYMVKPFDELELLKKVDNILTLSRRLGSLLDRSSIAEFEETARTGLERRGLSKREIEVAQLLLRGSSRKEIAAELSIAHATVKRHIENIYAKTEVQDRFQLFAELASSERREKK